MILSLSLPPSLSLSLSLSLSSLSLSLSLSLSHDSYNLYQHCVGGPRIVLHLLPNKDVVLESKVIPREELSPCIHFDEIFEFRNLAYTVVRWQTLMIEVFSRKSKSLTTNSTQGNRIGEIVYLLNEADLFGMALTLPVQKTNMEARVPKNSSACIGSKDKTQCMLQITLCEAFP